MCTQCCVQAQSVLLQSATPWLEKRHDYFAGYKVKAKRLVQGSSGLISCMHNSTFMVQHRINLNFVHFVGGMSPGATTTLSLYTNIHLSHNSEQSLQLHLHEIS